MGRNLDEVINKLPPDRQARIASLAEKKVEEMIAHAATLADFRKAVGRTQVEVAKELGIKQNAVSQLEKRSDTYVSTLQRFLQSLGMTLELSVVSKNGTRISLPHFHPWDEHDSSASPPARAATSTASRGVLKAAPKRKAKKEMTTEITRSATDPLLTEKKAGLPKKRRATPTHQ